MRRPPDHDRELFLKRTATALQMAPREVEERLSARLRSSLRLNPLRAVDPEATLAAVRATGVELAPLGWAPHAFHLHGDKAAVVALPAHAAGEVFLQNASSFVPAVALAAEPGHRVLDVCAAPGGKASHVAALVQNALDLHVNDALRADKLAEVLDLLGVRVAAITRHPGQYVDKFVTGPFDRVLLDAQCGGEGMIDLRHPAALRYWSLARIRKYHHLQRSMVQAAWRLLAPGGVLVYSTCTFAPEENEAVLGAFLKHHPDATVEPVALPLPDRRPAVLAWEGERFDPRLREAVRLAPSEFFEGFFVCRLRKAAGAR
jgi:16S rRNA (cytosine1407-C5)-methyltransferase